MTLLYCAVCGKPWRQSKDRRAATYPPQPKKEPPASCVKCRGKYRGAAQRLRWKHHRRRLALAGEATASPAVSPLPDLDTLIADADAASARALKLAGAIGDRFKPVARSSEPYKLDDITIGKDRPVRLR